MAYVLSIGEGKLSRIFKTSDGGQTWALQHENPDPKGFLDALAFWDVDHGLALGDPVEGRFVILATDDGGKSWKRTAADGMPVALPGEGAFAASGTCLVVQGDRNAWFATGGGRIFRSVDRGRSWSVHQTPISAGNGSSGIFSLAFWDSQHGVAVGGDFKQPDQAGKVCALSSDGGRTWRSPSGSQPGGYRSAVAFVPDSRTDPAGCRPHRHRPLRRRRRNLDEAQRRRLSRRGARQAPRGMGRRRARAHSRTWACAVKPAARPLTAFHGVRPGSDLLESPSYSASADDNGSANET